jgi:hypothetical protein
MTEAKFYGKYRGTVTNNIDPDNIGKIQVNVPALHGQGQLNWAWPSVPYAGMQNCFYAIPPMNANVWVEFEEGNLQHPIWSGCFWGTAEVPSTATSTPTTIPHIAMQTTGQTTFLLSDNPTEGITLKLVSGASIVINATGIKIDNGMGASIELVGPSVKINGTAFVVT